MLKDFAIIRAILTFIFPYILLYAIYIQLNGELSPGGGFQAGTIFAGAIIAYDLTFKQSIVSKNITVNMLVICGAGGVLIYGLTGVIALFKGNNFLNYYSLLEKPLAAQHLGIVMIELGVGLTVSAIMCLIYFLLKIEETSNEED